MLSRKNKKRTAFFISSQKRNVIGFGSFLDFLGPQGYMDFADMRLAQEEHADPGLADSSAYSIRKLFVQDRLLERKLTAVIASGKGKLSVERFLVNADSHGGKLKSNIQNRIVNQDISV